MSNSSVKKVRIDVIDVPNSTRDIKNKTGKTKKILPSINKTLAPVLTRTGSIATGATEEEFKAIMAKDPFLRGTDYKEFYNKVSVSIGIGGKEFDLSIPKDHLIWLFLKEHPEVCTDLKTLNPSKHTYLMVDKELEAEEKLTKIEYKVQAYGHLNEMTADEVKDFLILYGRNPDGVSPKVARTLIAEYIESNPSKFVTYYNDASRKYKIDFKKLMDAKILERRGGVYYYGEDVSLGASVEQAVEHLRSNANQELYLRLIELLEEKGN
jgi:hypothetical protein